MGVRGLTSYIARHAELYLTPYELHDCNLVIDGDNLACNLYKDVTGTYSAFGGDYDDFFRAVVQFFHVLAECNVCPYVLMDGGYERRKLRTVAKRFRGKIAVIKRINPNGSIPVFPLMMKEVFVDALRECGVPVMRCVFEADDELAALSRKLHCPVLSYDSDFYIHNVRYIPLVTLTVKAHTKRIKEKSGESLGESPSRRLRKNEVRVLEKSTKANRILGEIQVDNVEKRTPKKGKTYKYLDCCMYRIENLIARGSLSKEKLPLFAALLGNDYIARGSFKNFFRAGLGKVGRSRKMKQQQRRIRVILQWLKTQTAESALEKILTRLRKDQRESLQQQVTAATSGYSNEKCHSYDFFVSNYEHTFARFNHEDDSEDERTGTCDEVELVDGEIDIGSNGSEDEEEESSAQNNKELDEESDNDEDVNEFVGDAVDNIDDSDAVDDEEESDEDKTKQFPSWFLRKLYPTNLPRYFVDIIHLHKYINNPQIEHFPHNDCHEIALPILIYIFTLINNVEGDETKPRLANDGTHLPIEFTYITRATRVTNIRYYRYSTEEPPRYSFNPDDPNPLLFRRVFNKMHNADSDKLFDQLHLLPNDIQLYFLSIVYWIQKSPHCDLHHLHSLIICLVVLRTIDSTIPAERDLKAFKRRFGKIIKAERLARDKDAAEGVQRVLKDELKALPIPDRMPFVSKSDCYLVQDNILKHFHMQEIFKKKYDLYSTTVLHAFAEFQSVVFQLHSLNALLNFPFNSPHMAQSYCGVLLYNLYDLLRQRVDMRYYVQNFIFNDSQLMFDFYCFLLNWCEPFIPERKMQELQNTTQSVNKKMLKKKRQAARKIAAEQVDIADTNEEIVDQSTGNSEDDFFDLNNKFCTLKVV